MYEATNNPMFVWAAYATCRHYGDDLPAWVLEYFDRSAAALEALTDKPGESTRRRRKRQLKRPTTAITEALGFKRPGRSGRGTALLQSIEVSGGSGTTWHHLELAADVQELIE